MKVKSLTIDFSGLSAYRTCPRKFDYNLVKRRAPMIPSDALLFGSAIHKALAEWHKGGPLGTDTVCEANFKDFSDIALMEFRIPHDCARCRALAAFVGATVETHLADLTPDTARSVHHGLNLLWHYFRTYGEPHANYVPLMTQEHKPALELTLTAPLGKIGDTDILYKGTCDGAVTEVSSGRICGLEHKTTLYLNEAFLNRARLNDQITGYIFLLQENIHPDIDTFIWNVLQTANKKLATSPGECFARTSTRRTAIHLMEWHKNTLATCGRILHDIEADTFETNMPDGCSAWNSMCAFADVCNATPQEREGMLLANYDTNPWAGIEIAYV